MILASGVAQTAYIAAGLVSGATYVFKVEAQNSVGFSNYSAPTSILCARVPTTPLAPTTMNDVNNIKISWTAPDP